MLSVSSNGSTWVKLLPLKHALVIALPFSILERIDVGETITVFVNSQSDENFQYPRTDRRG